MHTGFRRAKILKSAKTLEFRILETDNFVIKENLEKSQNLEFRIWES